MTAPHPRRARIAAAASLLLVLCALPATAAIAGWAWDDGPAGRHFDDAIWMPLLSLMLAAAGVMRVVARNG